MHYILDKKFHTEKSINHWEYAILESNLESRICVRDIFAIKYNCSQTYA